LCGPAGSGARSSRLLGAPLCASLAAMDRKDLQRELEEAERELDAATRRSDVRAAAGRLQRAKAELALLDAEPSDRSERPSRGKVGGA
jgi:hypothetical protein